MELRGVVDFFRDLRGYQALLQELDGPAPVAISEAAKPVLLAALWRDTGRPLLAVTARPEQARHLHEQLAAYLGDDPSVLLLPEPDSLPYERLASDRTTVHQRIGVLVRLAGPDAIGGPPPFVVASAYAVAAKITPPDRFRAETQTIQRSGRVELLSLLRRWMSQGYQTANAVEVPGTVSRRGGIVDIFPPTYPRPLRIELFGDAVDSIRFFDPATQRSAEQVQSVVIPPAHEVLPGASGAPGPSFRQEGGERADGEKVAEELRRLAQGEAIDEIELYRGLLGNATALDYLPQSGFLVVDEPDRISQAVQELEEQSAELRSRLEAQGALPLDLPRPNLGAAELEARLGVRQRCLALRAFGADDARFPFATPPAYAGRTRVLLEDVARMRAEGQRIVLVSQQAPRLAELLTEAGMPAAPADGLPELPPAGGIALVHGSLAEGWSLPGERITLLTDAEIFGITKQRTRSAGSRLRRRPIHRQPFLAELASGDYLVHIDHGIGRFAGVTVRRVGEREREYLVMEYAGGDQLLVPTDQIDRVGPYVGASDRPPALTRLGTQEWVRVKERVKASTAQVARELLALYASRQVVPGHAFSPDAPWQAELEASFPYVETPDQMRTIREVKADMEQARPMDRVIAGDVGYGKTEVALRAAFKTVMDGKQAAVLVPTTVLAQQHFNTLSQRLAPFPVRVEMLSRFRSPREQEQVVTGLAAGTVDICIGTHRLLQKDIRFKDLGLVVIDEEQRFGVAHKERLKQLRREVDVLSMSATPIPRTLYMALAGVRDMSVMETPPEERLPIKTYVSQFDEGMVREAVIRELERGGQVFFVHNRVYNIGAVAERLARLVPEATIAIAHGQMPEERLEAVMLEFARGEADVLVSTTIIESGLDMPNVNTLVVNDADRMGLSQLYQLRGRVGRGATRAYAYFFYHLERRLTETAEKRLKTILSATELGAGFHIAMKDLEIRGAGNLLGVEQHGHIAAVGFDLYVRLLSDAVAEIKAGLDGAPAPKPPSAQPAIDLPMPARIPEAYVPDLSARLGVYQRMAALQEPRETDDLADELRDRFGAWPEEVENLLFMLKVKLLAAKAGVLSVSHETGELVLAGDERTWTNLLGVQRPYGDGVRIGHTRVRLDIKRLGARWRAVLEKMLTQAGERAPSAASRS